MRLSAMGMWSRAREADLSAVCVKGGFLVIFLDCLGVEVYGSGPILALKGIVALILELDCFSRRHYSCDVGFGRL